MSVFGQGLSTAQSLTWGENKPLPNDRLWVNK